MNLSIINISTKISQRYQIHIKLWGIRLTYPPHREDSCIVTPQAAYELEILLRLQAYLSHTVFQRILLGIGSKTRSHCLDTFHHFDMATNYTRRCLRNRLIKGNKEIFYTQLVSATVSDYGYSVCKFIVDQQVKYIAKIKLISTFQQQRLMVSKILLNQKLRIISNYTS